LRLLAGSQGCSVKGGDIRFVVEYALLCGTFGERVCLNGGVGVGIVRVALGRGVSGCVSAGLSSHERGTWGSVLNTCSARSISG
jgi:hypothetical protein